MAEQKRLLAIGDVHGCSTALRTLIDFARVGADDTVVTLGDYVDRGPDARGVLDLLINLSDRTELIPLLGNHEMMFWAAMESRTALVAWLAYGGDATLDSYQARVWTDLPRTHLDFLRNCRRYHETRSHFLVHANADAFTPLDAQPEEALFWRHLENEPVPHVSGKVMICGHTPQPSGLPKNFGHAICIDTNAQDGGFLTCLDVWTGRFWQANEQGQTRADVLQEAAYID